MCRAGKRESGAGRPCNWRNVAVFYAPARWREAFRYQCRESMSYGLYDTERRYRKRLVGRVLRFVLFVALLAGVGLFAYQLGIEDRKTQLDRQRDDLAAARAEIEALNQQAQSEQLRSREVAQQLASLQQRYERDMPAPEMQEMLALVRERLSAGVPAERLAFVIREASTERDCEPAETKRFLVRTPLSDGAASAVGFVNNTVTLTGQGESALNAEGRPEAWFDPAQPMTLTVTRIDGTTDQKTAVLPMTQSVVIGAVEHRFAVTAGQRGFVQVTAERCRFP